MELSAKGELLIPTSIAPRPRKYPLDNSDHLTTIMRHIPSEHRLQYHNTNKLDTLDERLTSSNIARRSTAPPTNPGITTNIDISKFPFIAEAAFIKL
jgi:hypothetical protein